MSDIENRARGLRELIDQYWSLAYAEGAEGRTHDTEAGDAQRVSLEIDSAIRAIAALTPPEDCVNEALDVDDVRKLFEHWAKGRDLTPDTWGVSSYVSPYVDNDWDVWLSAWQAIAARPEVK